MAQKKSTRAAPSPARRESRESASPEARTARTASAAEGGAPQGEAKKAAELEQQQGKVVTSTSAGPLAIPTAEVAGAGADRAAARAALRVDEQDRVTGEAGRLNAVAGLEGGMSVQEFLNRAEIGTRIEKLGNGVQIVSPVGGGMNRVFAGETFDAAKKELDQFFSGSPQLLTNPAGEEPEGDEEDEEA